MSDYSHPPIHPDSLITKDGLGRPVIRLRSTSGGLTIIEFPTIVASVAHFDWTKEARRHWKLLPEFAYAGMWKEKKYRDALSEVKKMPGLDLVGVAC
jgi:hypothetical protein